MSESILSIILKRKLKFYRNMPPCCDLPVKINETIQTGKEWAKPVATLLPPDGGAGSGNRKEFLVGAVSVS